MSRRYRAINCKICGIRVEPTNGMQKFCKPCSEEVYPPKRKFIVCVVCGEAVEPMSPNHKYCPSCRKGANQAVHEQWLDRHPGYMHLASKRQYHKNNKETHTAKIREWRRNNPEPTRVANHNRRAFLRGCEGSYTVEEVSELRIAQHNRCYYCNDVLVREHKDHRIPISRGGHNYIWNIALACSTCNCEKYTRTEDEFMEWKLCQEIRK